MLSDQLEKIEMVGFPHDLYCELAEVHQQQHLVGAERIPGSCLRLETLE